MRKTTKGHLVVIFDTVSIDNDTSSFTGHATMIKIYDLITRLKKSNENGTEKLNNNNNIKDVKMLNVSDISATVNNKEIIYICEKNLREESLQTSEVNIESLKAHKKISLYYRTKITKENKDNFDSDFLIPFITVRNSLRKDIENDDSLKIRLLLGIITDDKEESKDHYYRVSRYLFLESLIYQSMWNFSKSSSINVSDGNEAYSECYFIDYSMETKEPKEAKRLAINGIRGIESYLPLFPLNSISYKVFSSYVYEYFPAEYGFLNNKSILDSKEEKTKKDLLNIISEELKNHRDSFNNGILFKSKQVDKYTEILMVETIRFTCLTMIEKRNVVDTNVLYEYCKNISILSLLFLSALLRFSKGAINEKALIAMIRSSQEYADGVLQLIENAVEHAKEKAYLRFRVKERKAESIAKRHGYKYKPGESYYLEVLLVDLSGSSIPIVFKENLQKRQAKNPFEGKKLTISDFFTQNESTKILWDEYYSNISNVTHHFGLQRFLSVVDDGDGFFRVVTTSKPSPQKEDIFVFFRSLSSAESIYLPETESDTHLPGTEYNIILPIGTNDPVTEQVAVGFGVELDFTKEFIDRKTCYFPMNNRLSISIESVLGQEQKEKHVKLLREQISKYVDSCRNSKRNILIENKIILCFDLRQKDHKNVDKQIIVDIFCKALIQYLHNKNRILKHRIAIINASPDFIYGFASLFAVYCINTEEITAIRNQLKKTQIYVCDENLNNELLFVGGNLSTTYQYSDYLACRKAVYPKSLKVFQSSLFRKNANNRINCPDEKSRSLFKKLKISPFDLCVRTDADENSKTLFEKRVEVELQNDLQKIPLGCRLSDAHMRVGSKIHITESFYDATLLLASSYYTQRFSFLLAQRIASSEQVGNFSRITIVGYEDYSEALIFDIYNRLKNQLDTTTVTYTIYSDKFKESFKFNENIQKNTLFCIIVPVNSTLSTHNKIWAALSAKLKATDYFRTENYALIVVSHGNSQEEVTLQEKFWEEINKEKRTITTKFFSDNPIVNYNILLSSRWADPLTCEACFPQDPVYERPLLEVSKSSVMTYILSGLQEPTERSCINKIPIAQGSINYLKNNIIYGHIKCGGNHFQYYFQTEKLMESILNSTSTVEGNEPSAQVFSKWIGDTKNIIQKQRELYEQKKIAVYDIVVVPIQSTNGQFVHAIVSNVFTNLQAVLYIDTQREFRENIESKYSNLIALYQNNKNAGRKSLIRFHYVDSTISSGTTTKRAKSILRSLFPDETFLSDSFVRVSLFDTVTLLVNRCSANTMEEYVNKGNFHRFIDVKIPSMRSNHDNACVLCNQKRNYELIMSCCSTNEMYEWWQKKWDKISPKSYEQMLLNENQNSGKPDRDFLRLQSSHVFTDRLSECSEGSINKRETIRAIIIGLFDEIINGYTANDGRELKCLKGIINNNALNDKEKLEYLKKTIEEITMDNKEKLKNLKTIIDCNALKNKEKLENLIELIDHNPLSNREILESLISYIKVMSRPFLVYRKSTLEVVFGLLIELMEMITSIIIDKKKPEVFYRDAINLYTLLFKIYEQSYPPGQQEMQFNSKNNSGNKEFADLFVVLVVQLSGLGAKYLMRKENMKKILDTAKQLDISDFMKLFIASIKRVIVLNRDESIGFWFEWLLCIGEEYNRKRSTEKKTDEKYEVNSLIKNKANKSCDLLGFYQLLFLENTYVIHDAIEEFNKKTNRFLEKETKLEKYEEHIITKHINEYYFENYRRFMLFDNSFYRWLESETESEKLPFFTPILGNSKEAVAVNELIAETTKLLKLYRKLKEETRNVVQYYREVCLLIRAVTGCKNAAILGYDQRYDQSDDQSDAFYQIASADDSNTWENHLKELTKQKSKTLSITQNGKIIIMFESFSNSNNNQQSYNKIYIIIDDGYNNPTWTEKRLFMVRKILTFRSDFVTRINMDFRNDAFEYFRSTSTLLAISLDDKTATHTKHDVRKKVCEIITRKIEDDKWENMTFEMKNENLNQLLLLAQLASDSLINELYFESLRRKAYIVKESIIKGEENSIHIKETIPIGDLAETDPLVFNKKWLSFFESISIITGDDNEDEPTRLKIKTKTDTPLEFTDLFKIRDEYYPFLMVFALLQNAIKYGKPTTEGFIEVDLFIDTVENTQYLTISNLTSKHRHAKGGGKTTIKALEYYYNEKLNRKIPDSEDDRWTKTDDPNIYRFTIQLPIARY